LFACADGPLKPKALAHSADVLASQAASSAGKGIVTLEASILGGVLKNMVDEASIKYM
jgi:hypothetical protein